MFLRHHLVYLPSIAALTLLGNSLCATAQTTVSVAETQQFPNITTQKTTNRTTIPVPGTVATSSVILSSEYPSTSQASDAQTAQNYQIAQGNIDLGRPTRGTSTSYIGLAGNIGLAGGDTSLADGNFTIISKVGFSKSVSLRPSVLLGDNTTFLIPITYDFSFQPLGDPFTEPLPISPYVGVGAAIHTGDNSQGAFLLTGGIDVPLNNRFTATASVNAGFFDRTDIGLLIGVGYNFRGF